MYKRLKDYEGNAIGLFTDLLTNKSLIKRQNNDRYSADASLIGAELLSESVENHKVKSAYKVYQLACGHISEYQYNSVRLKTISCARCRQQKHEVAADKAGLDIIRDNGGMHCSYSLYKFRKCGHEKAILRKSVLYQEYGVCLVCEKNSRLEDANRNGLELIDIDHVIKKSYRVYKFNSCGHIQTIRLSDVAAGRIPECLECRNIRWREEASCVGLVFLDSPTKTSKGLIYKYILHCGCIKLLATGTVRSGGWACDVHSNYYCKPNNVYLFEFETKSSTWLKLGISSKLERRISAYKIKEPYKCSELYVVPTKNTKDALHFERSFHASHTDAKIDSTVIKQLMTNGWSECYPMSMKDYLICTLMDFEKELNGN